MSPFAIPAMTIYRQKHPDQAKSNKLLVVAEEKPKKYQLDTSSGYYPRPNQYISHAKERQGKFYASRSKTNKTKVSKVEDKCEQVTDDNGLIVKKYRIDDKDNNLTITIKINPKNIEEYNTKFTTPTKVNKSNDLDLSYTKAPLIKHKRQNHHISQYKEKGLFSK